MDAAHLDKKPLKFKHSFPISTRSLTCCCADVEVENVHLTPEIPDISRLLEAWVSIYTASYDAKL